MKQEMDTHPNGVKFAERLNELRMQKGVSARDMSLSLGQNPGYINSIETGKALPSLTVFFYICDYLQISPEDFFSTHKRYPDKINLINQYLVKLNEIKLKHISEIIIDLSE